MCYNIQSRHLCYSTGDNPMHTQPPCSQPFPKVCWKLKCYDYSTENNATVSKQVLILGWVKEVHLHLNTLKPLKDWIFHYAWKISCASFLGLKYYSLICNQSLSFLCKSSHPWAGPLHATSFLSWQTVDRSLHILKFSCVRHFCKLLPQAMVCEIYHRLS